MAYNNILEKIENIPFDPGCYIYKDKSGKVIYVGKAINLRKRVRQYFDRDNFEDPKIEVLRSNIDDVEWITVKTETEAYILESNLIKKYRPKFNKLQKDDKSYVWIKITNEVYPRILRVREKKRDKAKYYGPYPNGNAARKTINFLRKVYPYRVCNKKMYDKFVSSSKNKVKNNADKMYKNENDTFRHTKESRLCLDYHLGLCSGVCDNLISDVEYGKSINKIIDFLEGKRVDLLKQLSKQMKEYAINLDYENAAIIRDRINELAYITQKINVKSGQDEEIIRNKNEKAM